MKLLAGKFTSRSFMLLNRKPLMSAINSLKFLSAFVSINFPSIDFNCTFLCIRKSLEFPLPVFVFQFCFVFRKMWIFRGKNDFFPEFPAAEEKKKLSSRFHFQCHWDDGRGWRNSARERESDRRCYTNCRERARRRESRSGWMIQSQPLSSSFFHFRSGTKWTLNRNSRHEFIDFYRTIDQRL